MSRPSQYGEFALIAVSSGSHGRIPSITRTPSSLVGDLHVDVHAAHVRLARDLPELALEAQVAASGEPLACRAAAVAWPVATARAPAAAADSPIARRPRRSASPSSPASRSGGVEDSTWCWKSSSATSSPDSFAASARSDRAVTCRVSGSTSTNSSSTPIERGCPSLIAAQKRAGSRYSPHSSRSASQISPSVASARHASSIARDHVAVLPSGIEHLLDRGGDRGLVATRLPLGQYPDLLGLNLVGDPQDLQLAGHRVLVHVDADDLLLTLLQGDLVGERRLGDLGHEPAVLDARGAGPA